MHLVLKLKLQGKYNLNPAGDPPSGAFIVGNGISDISRSNLIFAAGKTVQITGSLQVSGSITGSLFGTASYALTSSIATSSSYALTASYVDGITTSLSDLGFTITPTTASIINQNIILPENCTVTYPSPLNMGVGYTVTVPPSTTFTII